MIFVIDAEDQQFYLESLDRMSSSVARLHEYNPKVIFDIFIHKEGYHTVSMCIRDPSFWDPAPEPVRKSSGVLDYDQYDVI